MRAILAAAILAAPAGAQEAAQGQDAPPEAQAAGAPTAKVTIRVEGLDLRLEGAEITLVLDPEQAARLIDALTAPPQ